MVLYMIKLLTKNLRPGMITGQGIYHGNGSFLLTRGTRLTAAYIQKLQELDVQSVIVTALNPLLNVFPPEDIVQEKTRIKAIRNVFDVFKQCKLTDNINVSSLKLTTESIIFDIIAKHSNLAQINDIRIHDDYTFSHSVNVAVLASMLGALCKITKQELVELTLGALLHDIGKTKTPLEILNDPLPLTDDEYNIIRQHPSDGAAILRQAKHYSTIPMYIAAQHHERYDGSGYPHKIGQEKIHKFARITAIADVYDALTSNRPYKKAYRPDVAYQIMTKCSNGQFDLTLLAIFFNNVAIYPVGTVLKTKFGYAIVKKVESGWTRKPRIDIFANDERVGFATPKTIDLKDFPENMIESVLDAAQLATIIELTGIDPESYLSKSGKKQS